MATKPTTAEDIEAVMTIVDRTDVRSTMTGLVRLENILVAATMPILYSQNYFEVFYQVLKPLVAHPGFLSVLFAYFVCIIGLLLIAGVRKRQLKQKIELDDDFIHNYRRVIESDMGSEVLNISPTDSVLY